VLSVGKEVVVVAFVRPQSRGGAGKYLPTPYPTYPRLMMDYSYVRGSYSIDISDVVRTIYQHTTHLPLPPIDDGLFCRTVSIGYARDINACMRATQRCVRYIESMIVKSSSLKMNVVTALTHVLFILL